jgi:hypothetical protein
LSEKTGLNQENLKGHQTGGKDIQNEIFRNKE